MKARLSFSRSVKALCLFILVLTAAAPTKAGSPWPGERPRLVVFMVIDQFRADYLSRFNDKFSDEGFKALIKSGAYFPYGEYDILQSMTGPGHATVLTGAYPYQMGIPVNDWYDQKTKAKVYCGEDASQKTIGVTSTRDHVGTSPKNLVGTTVGDEMKNIDLPGRVISLALKDRAAIMMGGHRADLAFWFDSDNKKWVSSSYYLKEPKLPEWMNTLNQEVAKTSCELDTACGIDMTVDAFAKAFDAYKLGQGEGTDLVAMSFSSHDFAGHRYGPNSPQMQAMMLAEDRAMARIRSFVKDRVPKGLDRVLFVLTGDHGVCATPEYLKENKIDSGRIDEEVLATRVEEALNKKYGVPKSKAPKTGETKALDGKIISVNAADHPGAAGKKWISYVFDFNFYLNEDTIKERKADLAKVEADVKAVLQQEPGFAHVFTADDVQAGRLPPGQFKRQIEKTFYQGRSGHVIGIQRPFYITGTKGTTHLTGYTYDRTVPILFSGFGIQPGTYASKAEVVDIAPTLSFILGVVPPALTEGKVLVDAIPKRN